jgi:ribosomal protein L29
LQQFLVMGKKKGSNKSNAVSVETIPRGSDDASAQQLSAGGEEPQASAKEQSNNNNQLEQMEVAELKAELLAARAELAKLRSQVQESGGAGKLLGKPQEVQELQSKLQQLRKEQQEADSARDKAWMQLKVCCTTLKPHVVDCMTCCHSVCSETSCICCFCSGGLHQ